MKVQIAGAKSINDAIKACLADGLTPENVLGSYKNGKALCS
ncbi:hypothetical protein [Desulfurella sp.]|nr:hypothetical protein [Desulfurella sp.]